MFKPLASCLVEVL